jgi:hypothetical protein
VSNIIIDDSLIDFEADSLIEPAPSTKFKGAFGKKAASAEAGDKLYLKEFKKPLFHPFTKMNFKINNNKH